MQACSQGSCGQQGQGSMPAHALCEGQQQQQQQQQQALPGRLASMPVAASLSVKVITAGGFTLFKEPGHGSEVAGLRNASSVGHAFGDLSGDASAAAVHGSAAPSGHAPNSKGEECETAAVEVAVAGAGEAGCKCARAATSHAYSLSSVLRMTDDRFLAVLASEQLPITPPGMQ